MFCTTEYPSFSSLLFSFSTLWLFPDLEGVSFSLIPSVVIYNICVLLCCFICNNSPFMFIYIYFPVFKIDHEILLHTKIQRFSNGYPVTHIPKECRHFGRGARTILARKIGNNFPTRGAAKQTL